MANPKAFLETLIKYDAWNIDKAVAIRAKKLAQDMNTSEAEMRKKSTAAAKIYAWADAVLAIAGFSPEQIRELPEEEPTVSERKLLA